MGYSEIKAKEQKLTQPKESIERRRPDRENKTFTVELTLSHNQEEDDTESIEDMVIDQLNRHLNGDQWYGSRFVSIERVKDENVRGSKGRER